jgi:acyl-coenzyme A thioesterase PaaI-like protein
MHQHVAVVDETPVRGTSAGRDVLALSGLDALAACVRGAFSPPPVCYLTGLRLDDVASGAVSARLPAAAWLLSSRGFISPAVLAIVADFALSGTVQSLLPAGTVFTTAELSLAMSIPCITAGGSLVARGQAGTMASIAASPTVVVEQELRGTVATGRACIALIPAHRLSAGADERTPPPGDDFATPHPYLCPVRGETLSADLLAQRDGLQLLCARIAGDLPEPPISHLTGARPLDVGQGWARCEMAASPWMASVLPGRMYGGFSAMFAGLAMEAALETLVPAAGEYALTAISVRFRRPVPLDGRSLNAHARATRRDGDRVVLRAEVTDADGSSVVTASGRGLLLSSAEYRKAAALTVQEQTGRTAASRSPVPAYNGPTLQSACGTSAADAPGGS